MNPNEPNNNQPANFPQDEAVPIQSQLPAPQSPPVPPAPEPQAPELPAAMPPEPVAAPLAGPPPAPPDPAQFFQPHTGYPGQSGQPNQPAGMTPPTPQAPPQPAQHTQQFFTRRYPQYTPPTMTPGPQPVASSLDYQNVPGAVPLGSQSKLRRLLIPVLLVAIAVLLGAGVWLASSHQENPDAIFRSAMETALSTKTVTQNSSEGSTHGDIQYDVSNIKNPKNSVSVSVGGNGLNMKIKGYGTLQNGYIAIVSFGYSSTDHTFASDLNKWVAVRQNGQDVPGADPEFVQVANPASNDLGDFIFGNFSAAQRQTLVNYAINNQVYRYNSKQVASATLNGKKVLVYSITENAAKLKVLNQKAAAMMGLSSSDIQTVLDQIAQNGNLSVKLYIEADSQQLVKVSLSQAGQAITDTYSGYNTTRLPAEPKASMTWQQFQSQTAAPPTGPTSPLPAVTST